MVNEPIDNNTPPSDEAEGIDPTPDAQAEDPTPDAQTEDPTPDDDAIVIKRETVTNIAIALIFLLLGFVLGGLFGTGILVSNSEAVASALVNNAPALAQQPSGQQVAAATPQPTPTPPPAVIDNVNIEGDPYLGPADAPITIVEFSDFRCGFCGRFHQQTLPLIIEEYGDQVRFVYRDFIAVGGLPQALAAECADAQGEFWAYHDALFEQQGSYNTSGDLISLADTLGLDVEEFTQCLENETYRDEVLADSEDGQAYGVGGTPTFFINGRRLVGAQPFSAFQEIIEEELEEAAGEAANEVGR
jgi:protein-disulfide isomerase